MKLLNLTKQYLPGSLPAFDGKMDYYYAARPWPPKYDEWDGSHVRKIHRMAMDTGFRYIVPDYEGARNPNHPELTRFLRHTLQNAQAAVPVYEALARIFAGETHAWQNKQSLPDDFIEWGFFGFPYNTRKVGSGEVSRKQYTDQVWAEIPVTAHFTAFYPSVYLKTADDLENYEAALTVMRESLDFIRGKRPVYPCIRREYVDGGVIPARECRRMLDTIRDVLEPDGLTYWEGLNAWSDNPMDKLQMLEELNRG